MIQGESDRLSNMIFQTLTSSLCGQKCFRRIYDCLKLNFIELIGDGEPLWSRKQLEMLVSSPGGRCWFGVELKTFEISIEEHKEKVHGKIYERGLKFCSSIRFGGKCLSLLLEGVESCCGLKKRTPFRKFWSEGNRDYSLELPRNRVGRFLF